MSVHLLGGAADVRAEAGLKLDAFGACSRQQRDAQHDAAETRAEIVEDIVAPHFFEQRQDHAPGRGALAQN